MKFIRKPVTVDAVQFLGVKDGKCQWGDAPRWLIDACRVGQVGKSEVIHGAYIKSDHPDNWIHKGDWLIKEAGNLSFTSNRYFAKDYEPA